MRNSFSLILLAMVLGLTAGCAQSSHQQGSLFWGQQNMQTAHHWNVLANDVANRINNELIRQHFLSSSIYVRQSCGKPNPCGPGQTFPFDQGFNDLLITQLVNFGINTVVAPDGTSLVVDYKVQVVYHQSERSLWAKPGFLTALAAGVVVLRDAPWEIIAVAAAVDAYKASTMSDGHYEVIITTSIVDKNKYVMRSSDIYYINDAEFRQYQQASQAAEIELTGPGGAPSPAKANMSSL